MPSRPEKTGVNAFWSISRWIISPMQRTAVAHVVTHMYQQELDRAEREMTRLGRRHIGDAPRFEILSDSMARC